MSKGAYIGVKGVARKRKKGYIGINGVARKIKKGYVGVDGVARQVFSSECKVTFTQSGTGYLSGYCEFKIDGTKILHLDDLKVSDGSILDIWAHGSVNHRAYIRVNGITVASGQSEGDAITYRYMINSDITVNIYSQSHLGCEIDIYEH